MLIKKTVVNLQCLIFHWLIRRCQIKLIHLHAEAIKLEFHGSILNGIRIRKIVISTKITLLSLRFIIIRILGKDVVLIRLTVKISMVLMCLTLRRVNQFNA